jgi:quercetin dioxygenase-like cupin family protein
MITTVHEWDGMLLSLFQMNAGEKIARHKHSHTHTTGVARGQTKVSIFYYDNPEITDVFNMRPGDRDFPFPANTPHEIEAIEDGTIVVNLCHSHSLGVPAKAGGLALDDGTVLDAA